jgi:membrane associated rhomboid family serine protease
VLPIHDENPTSGFAWLTVALIVANVAVFIWLQPRDSGIEDVKFVYEWAAVPCEVMEGRPLTAAENPNTNNGIEGRCLAEIGNVRSCEATEGSKNCTIFPDKNVWLSIVFSMFLHGGWLHLGLNMVFLWVFGNNIEDHLGRFKFMLFYLGAGVVATFVHIGMDTSSTIAVIGASGAIAGVMGAYLVWFPEAQVRTLVFVLLIFFVRIRAKWLLLIWFASQFLIVADSGVAWAAHVGGFIFGALVALIVRDSPRARRLAWTKRHQTPGGIDTTQGLWDNRFGGRTDHPFPPYESPST